MHRSVQQNVVFFHDPLGRLVYRDASGCQYVGVIPVRGFPVSEPDYGVSNCDTEGRGLLDGLLDEPFMNDARAAIEVELTHREFLPVLRKVVRISTNSEPCEWEVETNRGATRFVLRTDEDVRRLDGERALVTDAQGVSYLIEDLRALDPASRRYLERYL